jgi:hypothetical protein
VDPSGQTIETLMVSAMLAALRAELPAIVRAAVRAEMKRAELAPFVSPQRAHELTGLSVATIRRHLADERGPLRWKKVGSRILIETASLQIIDELAVARAAVKAVCG